MENLKLEIDKSDLKRLSDDLDKLPSALEKAGVRFVKDAKSLVVEDAKTFAMSGYYLNHWQMRELIGIVDAKSIVLENASGYADVIEAGRDDQPNRKPRYVAMRALDFIDARDLLRDSIDDEFDKILRK